MSSRASMSSLPRVTKCAIWIPANPSPPFAIASSAPTPISAHSRWLRLWPRAQMWSSPAALPIPRSRWPPWSIATAVAMDHGGQRERGIGRAAGDDHICARGQSLSQRECADIGVGAEDAIANGGDGFAGIHIAHFVTLGNELIEAREDIVAQYHRHLQAGREAHHFAGAGHGVYAAGIGDHFH